MVALGVGMMLGVGIFFGPTVTASEVPDSTIIILLWLLGACVATSGAWLFGTLATNYPRSGGPYVYLREAFGPMPAFLFVWTGYVLVAPAALALLATLFATMLSQIIPL